MYNLLHTSQRERQVRSLQSTLKSFYFHDRNVTRKKKIPWRNRNHEWNCSIKVWRHGWGRREDNVSGERNELGLLGAGNIQADDTRLLNVPPLDESCHWRGTVVSLVTVIKARKRATRGSPGVPKHWWAQCLCSAGLRALEQWPGAQSSCITRQKKMAHQPFLQQNPLDGHNRMQRMPCLTGTLGHAGFKSPFYYHGHCS